MLACFSLGREGIGIASYDDYVTKATAYIAAIDARARYCAPDMFDPTWMTRFAAVLAPTGQLAAADLHAYFGGDGTLMTGAVARDWLLSPAIVGELRQQPGRIRREISRFSTRRAVSAWPRTKQLYFTWRSRVGAVGDTFKSRRGGHVDYLRTGGPRMTPPINLHTGDHVSGAGRTLLLAVATSPAGYVSASDRLL